MNWHWPALMAAVAASIVGQGLLKAGAGAESFAAQVLDPRTLLGLGLYGASALFYIVALRRIPMSVALPSTAMSYVAAALVGYWVFGETLGGQQVAGVTLIAAGVVLLALA